MRVYWFLVSLCGVVWMTDCSPVAEEKSGGYSTGFDVVGRIEISNVQQGDPGYWQTHQQGGYAAANTYQQGGYAAGNGYQQGGYAGSNGFQQGGYAAGNGYQQGGYGGSNGFQQGGYAAANGYQQDGYAGANYQDQGYQAGGQVGYANVAVLQPVAIGYANPVQTYQSVPSHAGNKYEHKGRPSKHRQNKGHGGYDDDDHDDDDDDNDGYDNKHEDKHDYGYKPKHKKEKKPIIRPKVIIVKKLIPVSTTTPYPPVTYNMTG